jgi:hypothetical protein
MWQMSLLPSGAMTENTAFVIRQGIEMMRLTGVGYTTAAQRAG